MTAETDQTVGQLDEDTVLRVLEMIQRYGKDRDAEYRGFLAQGHNREARWTLEQSLAADHIANDLVKMYRASLGLEEV